MKSTITHFYFQEQNKDCIIAFIWAFRPRENMGTHHEVHAKGVILRISVSSHWISYSKHWLSNDYARGFLFVRVTQVHNPCQSCYTNSVIKVKLKSHNWYMFNCPQYFCSIDNFPLNNSQWIKYSTDTAIRIGLIWHRMCFCDFQF